MTQYISIIIALAINTCIVDMFVETFLENETLALILSLVITLAFAGILFSPIGTWFMRVQNRLQEPTELERSRIDPIFFDIYEKAKKKTPGLPQNIQWFILGDNDTNAFAVGLNTIGIHTGLLQQCSDSEIAAVLAHEFGHIAHKDTICSAVVAECNFLVLTLKTLFLLVMRIIFLGVSFLWALVNESDTPMIIGGYLTTITCWIINAYLSFTYYICIIPSYASRREQEYAADQYAAELGADKPLIRFLSRFPTPPMSFKLTLAQMFYGTHPKSEDRIARLQSCAQIQ